MAMNGAPVVLVDLVDGADVRMIERRRGARFAQEAAVERLVACRSAGRNLSATWRDKLHVFCSVDHAHAAGAEFCERPYSARSSDQPLGATEEA